MAKKYAEVDQERCVACGECVFECPRGAVSITNGCFASVNKERCIGCGICARHCPAGCITILERQANKDEEK